MNAVSTWLCDAHYLFVLDGLEVMQNESGDQYGEIKNSELKQFLQFFARANHTSFCIVTSRIPVVELEHYTTYQSYQINRLSIEEGCSLLEKLGVKGDLDVLAQLVESWDGHALTLSLLGSEISIRYKGDLSAAELSHPEKGEGLYKRVGRLLRRYDEHLTQAERNFMITFSAFRIPVGASAFEPVFKSKTITPNLENILKRLQNYRLIRYNPDAKTYNTHPLIRNHYYTTGLNQDESYLQAIHARIKKYYLAQAKEIPDSPTLDDLLPLIETVHHACQAGEYDEAHDIRENLIYQEEKRLLVDHLGAWETALAMMLEFFPNNDASKDPLVSKLWSKSWIINEVGYCLMQLGRSAL